MRPSLEAGSKESAVCSRSMPVNADLGTATGWFKSADLADLTSSVLGMNS